VSDADAVVIGAGPNGLTAANLLADVGWHVVVLEAQPEPGGAVRSNELVAPGFVTDWASSFYPLGYASPVLRALDLEDHGLRWVNAPLALAHPTPSGCALVERGDPEATARSLDGYARGDGDTWLRLYGRWERIGEALLTALMSPFPPVRGALGVARAAGPRQLPWLLAYPLRSVRGAARDFKGDGGRLLLAGNTMHTDLGPGSATGALFGWLLASVAQQVGFPVPEGGAGRLTAALVARLTAGGGELRCGQRVTRIEVRGGRASAVLTADGSRIEGARAVVADISAPALYGQLLDPEHVPWHTRRAMSRFRWDQATVKVDWALDGPVPWSAEPARRAGTVHVADSLDDLETYCAQIARGLVPARPFLVVGQTTVADPTRSPAGTESLWAYTHVPQVVRGDAGTGITGRWDDADAQRAADRIEGEIERRAPGFRALVRARHVLTPPAFEQLDANLVGGAVNGGTAHLRQQAFLRPVPNLHGGVRTPVRGLYLASASAHPGGGVHGACGANAVHAALRDLRH
jgi:phytoene dehydrogenase-like protein